MQLNLIIVNLLFVSLAFFDVAEPWLHVGCTMIGMYVGQKLPQWELKLVEDINEIRASKGMAPMVGTNAWIKYEMPEANAPLDKKY